MDHKKSALYGLPKYSPEKNDEHPTKDLYKLVQGTRMLELDCINRRTLIENRANGIKEEEKMPKININEIFIKDLCILTYYKVKGIFYAFFI